MNGLEKAMAVLPRMLQERLGRLDVAQANMVQEIRLRKGQPIALTGRGKTHYLSRDDTLTQDVRQAVWCEDGWVEQTLESACQHSLYAHQDELRQGYITTRLGCRIGIGGTAVLHNEEVRSFREITSLCLRVSRSHRGCADALLPKLYADHRVHSALICGEPSCGKTSVLADLLRGFSEQHVHPAVIDERGELKEHAWKVGCDVLCGIPKAKGVEQAVRCLAPPLILLDELGGETEIDAVTKGLYRGVKAIATVHCHDVEELLYMPPLKRALENGVFQYLVVLDGCEHPGRLRLCVKTKEWLCARNGHFDDYDGRGDGWRGRPNASAIPRSGIDRSEKTALSYA